MEEFLIQTLVFVSGSHGQKDVATNVLVHNLNQQKIYLSLGKDKLYTSKFIHCGT